MMKYAEDRLWQRQLNIIRKVFRFIWIIGLVLFLSLLTSCSFSNKISEKSILADLNSNENILNWVNFSSVSIQRSLTENKRCVVDVTFEGIDSYASYNGAITLYYNQYDDGKWMLDDWDKLDYDYYLTSTFDINNRILLEDIYDSNFGADSEYSLDDLDINVDNVEFTILDPDSDLLHSEIATVTIVSDTDLCSIKATITLRYRYYQGVWSFVEVISDNIDYLDLTKLDGKCFFDGESKFLEIEAIDLSSVTVKYSCTEFEEKSFTYYWEEEPAEMARSLLWGSTPSFSDEPIYDYANTVLGHTLYPFKILRVRGLCLKNQERAGVAIAPGYGWWSFYLDYLE